MSVRITSLEAQNVMRIKAVRIEPNGEPVIVVGGNNGEGKTSLLRALEMTIAGAKAIPPKPVRNGEEQAEIVVRLSNGLIVRRTLTADGKSKLTITDEDGLRVKSPQALLDKMYKTLAIDPLAMARMRPQDQAAVLREIAGVDTEQLDRQRQAVFDRRTDQNREVKRLRARLEAAPRHPDAPAEEVSVAELASELELASEQNREAEETKTKARDLQSAHEEAEDVVRRLSADLEQAKARARGIYDEYIRADAAAREATLVDTTPIRELMRTAEATNAKVRANRQRAELERELKEAERAADRLTGELAEIDAEKEALLASANLPVPGLGFDTQGVTLDGVPLEQASQSQQLRLWTAVGFRQNPELKVLLVRSGSDLDENSLRLLGELAAAEDGEVWIERVSTGEECSVVIEDGCVRAPAPAPATSDPAEDFA